jgi:DNA-binding transcriptional LysR family regulator
MVKRKQNLSPLAQPTVKELEAFLLIVRLGGFTRAAEHLKTTQAAVSARMRELQRKLGLTLFESRAKLTARGRALVPYAERMASLSREIAHRFVDASDIGGIVRFGISGSIATGMLPKLIRQTAARHPSIEIEFVVDLSANLARRLNARTIDLAIMASYPSSRGFTADVVGRMPLCWLASRALAAPRRVLTPAELAAWPIISDVSGSHVHQLVARWFQDGGVEPQIVHGCSSVVARMNLVTAALGVGAVPATSVAVERSAAGLQGLETHPPLPEVEYVLAYPSGSREPSVDRVIAQVRDLLAKDPSFRFSGVA